MATSDSSFLERQEPPDPGRTLAALEGQIVRLRGVLSGLMQDIAQADAVLENHASARLVAANEQLVLTALRSQEDAETASQELNEVTHAAGLDALTGLPNRGIFLDRCGHAMASARRHGSRLALLFMDLNRFKQINDTLGHALGDEVLMRVARCLRDSVREGDTVSRHGGDEFLILLTELADPSDAARVAGKVLAALGEPHQFAGHVLRLSASIGISIFPDDAEDAQALIDHADRAMYRAKRDGADGLSYFAREGPAGGPAALNSLKDPLSSIKDARVEHGLRLAQLQEANERLLLASLDARELLAASEGALLRQTQSMTMVIHELRNPLQPLRLAAAVLNRKSAATDRIPSALALGIESQVRQMARLIDDLLDVGRATSGMLRVKRQPMDLLAAVDAAVQTCRPGLDTRLQALTVSVPAGSVELHGDAQRVVQVISNLLNNASKYTPESGAIDLSVTVASDEVLITITDTGIGITAEALPKIFEPFVQDAHAVQFDGTGLGVGLTVVQQIVVAHGGSVTATSGGRDLGSQFFVRLPLSDESPLSSGRPPEET